MPHFVRPLTHGRNAIMIRLRFSIQLHYGILDQSADFIFNIHAAETAHQTVLSESLTISQAIGD